MTIPTVVTAAGLQPIAPVDLRTTLVNNVAAVNPGYTSDLPGTLIEDIASTDVGALVLIDQMRVELVNSVTPYGANEFLLLQLGNVYGVPLGGASNTSVQVVFTGSAGFVITPGFVVSDGLHQYVVSDGGVVDDSLGGGLGVSGSLSARANQTGSWAVPPNTVVNLTTSVPSDIVLSVNNPLAGTPGGQPQSFEEYRVDVLRAGLAATQGMPRYLKTQLRNVPGVDGRLISMRQKTATTGTCGAWEVIVGGNGDNYQVAYAIFNGLFNVSELQGSEILVLGITQANPGVVTTDLNHGLVNGETAKITGLNGMGPLNNVPFTVTVINPTSFSVGIDTSGYPVWVSGGVVTPNHRNVEVSIDDYPDSYLIRFVVPPQQTVNVNCNWNTSSANFVASASISSLAAPALVDYINSIPVGQPINVYSMESVFRTAVQNVISPDQITRLAFEVSIDGIGVDPPSGTGVIAGDPESYFFATSASVQVVQG